MCVMGAGKGKQRRVSISLSKKLKDGTALTLRKTVREAALMFAEKGFKPDLIEAHMYSWKRGSATIFLIEEKPGYGYASVSVHSRNKMGAPDDTFYGELPIDSPRNSEDGIEQRKDVVLLLREAAEKATKLEEEYKALRKEPITISTTEPDELLF